MARSPIEVPGALTFKVLEIAADIHRLIGAENVDTQVSEPSDGVPRGHIQRHEGIPLLPHRPSQGGVDAFLGGGYPVGMRLHQAVH